MTLKKKIVRIDGRQYTQGSPEHQQAFTRACQRMTAIMGHLRLDELFSRPLRADETAFLARDLVFVSSEVQQVLYDRLRAKEFVPMTSLAPPGAESWVYRTRDFVGEALIGASLQADDAPLVDLFMGEESFPFLNITAGYAYNVGELEAAALAGIPLARDKANACAEIIARGIDEVARIGKPAMGIFGFFNTPDVPEITLPNGEWLTATPAEILADLAAIEQAATTNSRDNFVFDTLVLPTAYEARLRYLQIDSTSETTVAQYFFGGPGMPGTGRTLRTLERWIQLDDATGEDIGVDDPPMGIAYSKNPAVLSMDVPIMYREEPPQARNFKFVVPARARAGGVVFKQPRGALYIKNLD